MTEQYRYIGENYGYCKKINEPRFDILSAKFTHFWTSGNQKVFNYILRPLKCI